MIAPRDWAVVNQLVLSVQSYDDGEHDQYQAQHHTSKPSRCARR
ncbi:MAG: hypothetical protein ABI700_01505 [Chloroflexota bacterium]